MPNLLRMCTGPCITHLFEKIASSLHTASIQCLNCLLASAMVSLVNLAITYVMSTISEVAVLWGALLTSPPPPINAA